MALKDLFPEIEAALRKYPKDYSKLVQEQSQRYVHETYYTKEWVVRYGMARAASYLRQKKGFGLTRKEWKKIEPQVFRRASQAYSIIDKDKLKNEYGKNFVVLASTLDSNGKPTDSRYKPGASNQVTIHKSGSAYYVRFYQSFTMGQGYKDWDNQATRRVLKAYLARLATLLYNDAVTNNNGNFTYTRRDGTTSPGYLTEGKGGSFVTRHHGGQGKAVQMFGKEGQRNDSTTRMVDFLEKMWVDREDNTIKSYSADDLQKVQMDINDAFNAAYKLEGLSKIDLFGGSAAGEFALKNLVVKVVIGPRSKKHLMSYADKGDYIKGTNLDGFMSKLRATLMKEYAKKPDKQASLSIEEMMRRGVFAKVATEMKKASGMPDMRFKINKDLVKKARYKEEEKAKARALSLQRAKTRTTRTGGGKSKVKYGGQGMRTSAADNPLALEALLNQMLPKVVASKMTSPALNYRTGRFAESVEAQDVMVGPKGGLAVNYTYMKYPYQTFEPGFAQGSTQRDPRKIIGESVREIAQSIIGDRFLRVRRV